MALTKALILATAAFALVAAEKLDHTKHLEETKRTIFFDGGSTDAIGITDVFLYIGTFVLATITALAILGLIYSKSEDTAATGTGYEAPATSYAAYEQAYSVARNLYDGYKKYEEEGRSSADMK
ncbi:unnamed protein product [Meganyctiphanes norvegica]|uniref:Uncharacterized protein n=1 Tax=Meganyctiphanes norvegica TaxID=48144 RepID=A0AAV2QS96_MEGNR